jgi:hypothetical protein
MYEPPSLILNKQVLNSYETNWEKKLKIKHSKKETRNKTLNSTLYLLTNEQ